jgi:hypothetical protein
MRLRNDPNVGLDYEVDLPDTTAGNDTYVLTKRGDLRSASMGFVAYESEFRHEGSVLVRHLLSIRLTEISPCAVGAYPQTLTALRHLAQQFGEDPDDILELARKDELRSLFVRTDLAPPTPLEVAQRHAPAPALVESRSDTMDTATARAQLERMDPRRPKSNKQLQLELMRMRGEWHSHVTTSEARARLDAERRSWPPPNGEATQ